ncbi:1-acyl-sn-glycerol-3-phosphate acyltransferase [Anaerolineales bacterium]|nr:1-acyl-sn-glycerol-3-phosphate acyltransferase [Anaerolineales bacterium]
MKTTIFNTPIFSPLLRFASNSIMRLAGWRVDGTPPDLPKYIIIGAPHTSNWDFLLFLGIVFRLKINVSYMGKVELFRSPISWFFYYCGGIPVDRSKSTGLVEQTVEACEKADHFILVIAPEGTRHGVKEWKRGFYHIAKGAGIPIVLAKVDGRHKAVHVGQVFYPTEDVESDMNTIQGMFKGLIGIKPPKKYIPLED